MNEEQAVIIYLDGISLPDSVHEQYDLATLDELISIVQRSRLGEFDGNEVGPTETILYLYGPDANALFKGIEPALRANPLCQNAKVTIRSGAPVTATTEVLIPKKA
ncbi:MAG TPA: hypothetical protein VNY05_38245 [Candidatus Acidoferrales bacterium]|jgi:hypothetical protein|nr:hypothetical protein [Candidatus Acidoferrales bacterium]